MLSFIKDSIIYILQVTYRFYGFETDKWMRYYYSIFAGCMFILFYLSAFTILIGQIFEINILKLNTIRYGFFSLLFIAIIEYYFFKNRTYYEKIIKVNKDINPKYFWGVVFFIFLTFFHSFLAYILQKIISCNLEKYPIRMYLRLCAYLAGP